jgi:predicted unusual protein kinase regulating ubiquinone biosynthesis (AarF/ABC1/UbiB family)
MRILARGIDLILPGPNKIKSMIDEFEMWTLEELDYLTEACYTEQFYKHFKNKKSIVVPNI